MVSGFSVICFTTVRRMGSINGIPGRLSSTHFMYVYTCVVFQLLVIQHVMVGGLAWDG